MQAYTSMAILGSHHYFLGAKQPASLWWQLFVWNKQYPPVTSIWYGSVVASKTAHYMEQGEHNTRAEECTLPNIKIKIGPLFPAILAPTCQKDPTQSSKCISCTHSKLHGIGYQCGLLSKDSHSSDQLLAQVQFN